MHAPISFARRTSPSQNGRSTPGSNASAAVLTSGGIDSAVLIGEFLAHGAAVHPLYVRCGLRWEHAELSHVRSFLDALARPSLRPLEVLAVPVDDVYGEHWSLSGRSVPDENTADEAVFLPGRNVLLLAKAMLWCHLHDVPTLAIGSIGGNPFPDATASFVAAYGLAVNKAVGGDVRIERPFADLAKADVMRKGRLLPLELTFSCLNPRESLHCGQCNKCAERRGAFDSVRRHDPTCYAARLTQSFTAAG